MFALVDGNNFYCSCERVFQPRLIGRPVVVLSSNDGCVIARSDEAKGLGIKMGAPWFQVRSLERTAGLVALSANFALYSDISHRMMSLASGLGDGQEVYSIDECFVDLAGVPDVLRRARAIRGRILRWVGVPTCIGIARTKTLAKLANHIAKSAERKPGSYPSHLAQVCDLSQLSLDELDELLEATPVGDVWGVGRRLAEQLKEAGAHTALDLARMDCSLVRGNWGVVLERTALELQGRSCINLESEGPPRAQLACTRSFAGPVSTQAELLEAVSQFTSRAAERLRLQGSVAGQVHVFAQTSSFKPGPRFSGSALMPLAHPSDDTATLVQAATQAVKSFWKPGFDLARAGVLLLDLMPASHGQRELAWSDEVPKRDRSRLMATVDRLNARYGRDAVRLASSGTGEVVRPWQTRQERKTPNYTTRIEDIPRAQA